MLSSRQDLSPFCTETFRFLEFSLHLTWWQEKNAHSASSRTLVTFTRDLCCAGPMCLVRGKAGLYVSVPTALCIHILQGTAELDVRDAGAGEEDGGSAY